MRIDCLGWNVLVVGKEVTNLILIIDLGSNLDAKVMTRPPFIRVYD